LQSLRLRLLMQLDKPFILSVVKEEIADKFAIPLDQIKDTTHLRNDLQADSLDSTELFVAIEDKLDISIDSNALELKSTPEEIADYIISYINESSE
jgi:acyl carrier protein